MKKIGLLLLGFTCFCCFDAKAFEFTEKMNVRIGVFDAARVKLGYDKKENEFNIKAEVETANFFGGVYPFLGQYGASGKIVKNEVKPMSYNTKTKSRNHERTKKILYNESAKPYRRISSKDGKINEVDIKNVPNSASSGDLQTVFAEMIEKFNKNRDCSLVKEVYDGKKHYKVIAKNEGVENRWFDYMQKSRNAYKCSMYIENLKENNDNILWDVSAETPIYMWLDVNKEAKMPKILEIRIDSTPLGELQVLPSDL